MYFEQLPLEYQEAINKCIVEWLDDEDKVIGDSYREYEAYHLLECDLDEQEPDWEEFGITLIAFRVGWLRGLENKQLGLPWTLPVAEQMTFQSRKT